MGNFETAPPRERQTDKAKKHGIIKESGTLKKENDASIDHDDLIADQSNDDFFRECRARFVMAKYPGHLCGVQSLERFQAHSSERQPIQVR